MTRRVTLGPLMRRIGLGPMTRRAAPGPLARRAVAVLLLVVAVGIPAAAAIEASLDYVEGITQLTGGCFIQAIRLQAEPAEGTAYPEIEGAALYGVLTLADGRHAVFLEQTDVDIVLRVDIDGTGSFVPAPWEGLSSAGWTASVPFTLTYDGLEPSPYRAFLMWNPQIPTVLTYCRDTFREGMVRLGARDVRIAVLDEDTDGRYDLLEGGALLIDADGDGELLASSDSHERFALAEPFNIDGTTYRVDEVAADGAWIRLTESDVSVAPKPPLLAGFPAPDFEGVGLSDEAIWLSAFRGSIVVLDFWASWCGPCVAEMPTFRHLHDAYADRGVVVLGVNLDRSEDAFLGAVDEFEIESPQIYDGADGPLSTLYRIEGIPTTYLIDRDGLIHARDLRGQDLIDAVDGLLNPSDAAADGLPDGEPGSGEPAVGEGG